MLVDQALGQVLRGSAAVSERRYEGYYRFRARHPEDGLQLHAEGRQAEYTELDRLHGVSPQRAARHESAGLSGARLAPPTLPAGAAAFFLYTAAERILVLDGPFEFAQVKLESQFGVEPDHIEHDTLNELRATNAAS